MDGNIPGKRAGLTREQAQKVLDYVADRLSGTDLATADRLLEQFVDRLRGLDDLERIKRLVEQRDDEALKHLGGAEGARGMLHLVEKIGRG
jgi:hypothetical protein